MLGLQIEDNEGIPLSALVLGLQIEGNEGIPLSPHGSTGAWLTNRG